MTAETEGQNQSKPVPSFRVALLADSATQHLARGLRRAASDSRLSLDVFEADYGQIDQLVFDASSRLYSEPFDFVLVFHCADKLHRQFQRVPVTQRAQFAEQHVRHVEAMVTEIERASTTRVLYFTVPETDDAVFGSYGGKVRSSWLYQVRSINRGLIDLAESHPNLLLVDLAALAAEFGYRFLVDRRLSVTSQMAVSMQAIPVVSRRVVDVVGAQVGRGRKCLILDLDNTLWGGVIGDDGIEGIEVGDYQLGAAYSDLQGWAKQLMERGVLLAVCSKNDDSVARAPFELHPHMTLRLSDIAAFVANWDNKADNIRRIRETLNIGFDSMVFVDDNPAERDLVRRELPEVTVPELPEDPVDYLPFLRGLNLFETSTFTAEDAGRTVAYRTEADRRESRSRFTDERAFLASLEMSATIEGLTDFNVPRVAQLSQRSNQFNLRTVRYSPEQLQELRHSSAHVVTAYSLDDKFGSSGLVSVVVLHQRTSELFIDSWFMSCRVLKRGLEQFILNRIVEEARQRGASLLVGEYLPTAKNALVKDHYRNLGFVESAGLWYLDVNQYVPQHVEIRQGDTCRAAMC